jgi:hypothetical protein
MYCDVDNSYVSDVGHALSDLPLKPFSNPTESPVHHPDGIDRFLQDGVEDLCVHDIGSSEEREVERGEWQPTTTSICATIQQFD